VTQHASLTPERWARFTLDQQADASCHADAFRCLLCFTPAASRPIAHLMP
jgi:hypothetical protein